MELTEADVEHARQVEASSARPARRWVSADVEVKKKRSQPGGVAETVTWVAAAPAAASG